MSRGCQLALLALVSLNCASPGRLAMVHSEYWAGEDLTTHSSYAWLQRDGESRRQTQPADHRLHDLVRAAIDRTLSTKGFVRQDTNEADLLVTYHCKITEKLSAERIDRVWVDRGEGEWQSVTPRVEFSSFEEGSIVIDFSLARDGRRVWRGVARGRLSPDASHEQLAGIVDRSVREILGQFPPR